MSPVETFVRVRPFRVAGVVAASLRVFGHVWWKLFLIAAVPTAIQFALAAFSPPTVDAVYRGRVLVGVIPRTDVVVECLDLLASAFANAVSVFGVHQVLLGRNFVISESLLWSLRRFAPLVAALILYALIVALGSVLLVVPGIAAYLAFSVTAPVCVVEGRGPIGSLRRSGALTRGVRWRLMGLELLVRLPLLLVVVVMSGVMFAFLRDARLDMEALGGTARIVSLATQPVTALYAAFLSAVSAVTYRHLRNAREGVDGAMISDVFT